MLYVKRKGLFQSETLNRKILILKKENQSLSYLKPYLITNLCTIWDFWMYLSPFISVSWLAETHLSRDLYIYSRWSWHTPYWFQVCCMIISFTLICGAKSQIQNKYLIQLDKNNILIFECNFKLYWIHWNSACVEWWTNTFCNIYFDCDVTCMWFAANDKKCFQVFFGFPADVAKIFWLWRSEQMANWLMVTTPRQQVREESKVSRRRKREMDVWLEWVWSVITMTEGEKYRRTSAVRLSYVDVKRKWPDKYIALN